MKAITGNTIEGMNGKEYQACIENLGLLEGEEIELEYVCFRHLLNPRSSWDGNPRWEVKKGLLVFTNDNLIFMQQEGRWSSNYAQALRIPLEHISGVVSGGVLVKHIRIQLGFGGPSEFHEFVNFAGISGQEIHDVRADIQTTLKEVREEKRRKAQEALSKGVVPAMIFCKYCGARNRADQSNCANCRAVLT